MKTSVKLKKPLLITFLVLILISVSLIATACNDNKGPVTYLGEKSVSATKSWSDTVSLVSCKGYSSAYPPEAKVRIKCEKTGIYLISASSAGIASENILLQIQDVCEQYTYTPTVGRDNMLQYQSNNIKGDDRIFAIRLIKDEIYYIKVQNNTAKQRNFNIKISYCKDSLSKKYSTMLTNKSDKNVNTYDSKVWLNILSKEESPTKKNGISETVMVAWLNRDDILAFKTILGSIKEISNADVKKQAKDVTWFIFSNAVSVLGASIVPDPISKAIGYIDTFKSICDLISGHCSLYKNEKSSTILKNNFENCYLGFTKQKSLHRTRDIGTKVVITRTYNKYSIKISNWDDRKKQELVAPQGNLGIYMQLEDLDKALEGKVIRIKQ